MRAAFLTPEYVTTHPNAGGLASFLSRITRVLADRGHDITVVTLDPEHRGITDYHGVRVVNVEPLGRDWPVPMLASWRARKVLPALQDNLRIAWALGHKLTQLEGERAFDFVHGSNFGATSLFVPRRADRPVITRWSSAYRHYVQANGGDFTRDCRAVNWLQRRCGQRSDRVYAPCHFTAGLMSDELGRTVDVIRPPLHTAELTGKADKTALNGFIDRLPNRFLLHCGRLSKLKGTDLVIDAALRLHRRGITVPVVLAGIDNGIADHLADAHAAGLPADAMVNLGPVSRPALLALMQRSVATLAPSRCDNLPNTVIESLALGVPVIGSDGVSINELVTHGHNGQCVPIGDIDALAAAMQQAWDGHGVFADAARPVPPSTTLCEMDPDLSAEALIRYAGYADCNDQERRAA